MYISLHGLMRSRGVGKVWCRGAGRSAPYVVWTPVLDIPAGLRWSSAAAVSASAPTAPANTPITTLTTRAVSIRLQPTSEASVLEQEEELGEQEVESVESGHRS